MAELGFHGTPPEVIIAFNNRSIISPLGAGVKKLQSKRLIDFSMSLP